MKIIGIAVWCFAFAIFAIQLFQNTLNTTYFILMAFALLGYLPWILYGWLWGHQKGHRVHFLAILLAAYIAGMSFFRDSIPLLLYIISLSAFLLIMFLAVKKYRPGFVADFKNKIKRDHFTGLTTRF